ncbi:MAG TPA: hypothetical protein VGQ00_01080 [Candidatus Norongarragalinales archaeon]|jgi:hypothetical protein|nr:hypothetical protein [Candidatus Norongarragalinales archaeon]
MKSKILLVLLLAALFAGCIASVPEGSVLILNQSLGESIPKVVNFTIDAPQNYCKLFMEGECGTASCAKSIHPIMNGHPSDFTLNYGNQLKASFSSFSRENTLTIISPFIRRVAIYGVPVGNSACK